MWTIGDGTADVLRALCTTPDTTQVAYDTLVRPALLIVVGLGMVAYDSLRRRQRVTRPHQAAPPLIEHPDAARGDGARVAWEVHPWGNRTGMRVRVPGDSVAWVGPWSERHDHTLTYQGDHV